MIYLLDYSILLFVLWIIYRIKWIHKGKNQQIIFLIFGLYLISVISVTLMPFLLPIPGEEQFYLDHINWIPFVDIINQRDFAISGILLNVLLFIPFGFIMPALSQKKSGKIIFYGFLFSLGIETMQLIYVLIGRGPFRVFDITDLMTNTLGAALGVGIFYFTRRLYQHR